MGESRGHVRVASPVPGAVDVGVDREARGSLPPAQAIRRGMPLPAGEGPAGPASVGA